MCIRDSFVRIQNLSEDFFDKTDTGELMSRVKDDIDKIWDLSLIHIYIWGRSSVGRAPALQAGGQEFESLRLH